MPVLDEVLSANDQYASSFGARSELALPPARRFAILTCMDARLDPAKYAGLRVMPLFAGQTWLTPPPGGRQV